MPRCADCGYPEDGYLPLAYFRTSKRHGELVCADTRECRQRQKAKRDAKLCEEKSDDD